MKFWKESDLLSVEFHYFNKKYEREKGDLTCCQSNIIILIKKRRVKKGDTACCQIDPIILIKSKNKKKGIQLAVSRIPLF